MKIGEYLQSIGQEIISCHRDDSARDAATGLDVLANAVSHEGEMGEHPVLAATPGETA